MGYRLNRLDGPVFMAGPKPILTEFGIHQSLESFGVVNSEKLSGKVHFQQILRIDQARILWPPSGAAKQPQILRL